MTTAPVRPIQAKDTAFQGMIPLSPSNSTTTSIRRKPLDSERSSSTLPSPSQDSSPVYLYQPNQNTSNFRTPLTPSPITTEIAESSTKSESYGQLADQFVRARRPSWTARKTSRNSQAQGLLVSPFTLTEVSHNPMDCDINKPDGECFPLIIRAARDGLEDMVRKLLVSNANIEACQTETKRNALSEASKLGHDKIVNLLIRRGCSLDHIDADSMTALHHATVEAHLGVTKHLSANKASIDMKGPAQTIRLPCISLSGYLTQIWSCS